MSPPSEVPAVGHLDLLSTRQASGAVRAASVAYSVSVFVPPPTEPYEINKSIDVFSAPGARRTSGSSYSILAMMQEEDEPHSTTKQIEVVTAPGARRAAADAYVVTTRFGLPEENTEIPTSVGVIYAKTVFTPKRSASVAYAIAIAPPIDSEVYGIRTGVITAFARGAIRTEPSSYAINTTFIVGGEPHTVEKTLIPSIARSASSAANSAYFVRNPVPLGDEVFTARLISAQPNLAKQRTALSAYVVTTMATRADEVVGMRVLDVTARAPAAQRTGSHAYQIITRLMNPDPAATGSIRTIEWPSSARAFSRASTDTYFVHSSFVNPDRILNFLHSQWYVSGSVGGVFTISPKLEAAFDSELGATGTQGVDL
jgi:hypothetical protein